MLAPPTAALTGIGITSMWELYKEGGRKSWLLPGALLANGAVQLLMLSYFINTSSVIKVLMVLLIILCFGSSTVLTHSLNNSFPAAGLELLSESNDEGRPQMNSSITVNGDAPGSTNSSLIDFLLKNKAESQKYLLVVSSANEASDIIIKTGEPVMAIGGFLGGDKSITLDQFIELAKKGEVSTQ